MNGRNDPRLIDLHTHSVMSDGSMAPAELIRHAKEAGLSDIGGVMHCFSYSKEIAKIFLDMGVYLGIGGVVTFKNARKLVETVE